MTPLVLEDHTKYSQYREFVPDKMLSAHLTEATLAITSEETNIGIYVVTHRSLFLIGPVNEK